MTRVALASAVALSVLALAACSGRTTGANSSAATANAGSAATPAGAVSAAAADNAPLYPDWARAVAPPYPNASVALLVNTGMYQFQSTDDPATVLAWYKSHVSASWVADAGGGDWNAKVNDVQISVARNDVTSTPEAAKIKTMIQVSHN